MYHNSVLQRPQDEEEERLKRDKGAASSPPLASSYTSRSPTLGHFNTSYSSSSPTNGSYSRPGYSSHSQHPPAPAPLSIPTTAHSPRVKSPLSPPTNGLSSLNGTSHVRERASSNYYDPTSDQGDGNVSWGNSHRSRQSPVHARQKRDSSDYADPSSNATVFNGPQASPDRLHFQHHSPSQQASHSHTSSRPGSISQSPVKPSSGSPLIAHNANTMPALASSPSSVAPLKKPSRPTDPMSFSSILSNSNLDSPTSTKASHSLPQKESRQHSKITQKDVTPTEDVITKASHREFPRRTSHRTSNPPNEVRAKPRSNVTDTASHSTASHMESSPPKSKSSTSEKENDVALARAKIDEAELSDLDLPEFDVHRVEFAERSKKRMREIEAAELAKRKRRRTAFAEKLSINLGRHAGEGGIRFSDRHRDAAVAEVQQKEVMAEKERKKDMQRKRRREKTVQNELEKRNEAIARAQRAADAAERDKFFKEAQRADRKAKHTRLILQRGDGGKELREVTPLAPNLEGGTMNSFPMSTGPTTVKKKSGRGGARPRKSKEQKQAEKDAAEAAHAALEKNEPVKIVPKEDRRETLKRETKEPKDVSPAPFVPYVSKGYNQIYEQIWRDLARKDIPRVYRIKENSLSTKQSNLRKTAQLASKEARRWQLRTNKSMKDVQARAKRSMREMMSFWKRNEREERDLRRMAEKQELENARKAEADREANRQRRKLNFLISQTELYSHFIQRKVKTDEVERSTDSVDVAASGEVIQPGKADAPTITLPDEHDSGKAKVTNFENLDFDDEDESKLRAIASANAQHAIQEAQDRARSFDRGGKEVELKDADFDEGEMNFQNPTSLGDTNVGQPKMLTAQLKEYQLKGLNWLVNLYEQGINGILADEMGLGKTVQSISLVSYLAESHNIWGPFLVIAPSSTLHNWQQEIAKFVPSLKVLPYWGNAKDRKVLRKFWDRKHITYNRDAPFHILVTSYQLVVQDTQYFQKIKWQYMILDEAQAIKSSSSSRWKSLLGFHCRNRLLLTGTPIQNNMQELWALLHFIMPTLFDSHDEFAEWFSKDIESHAQSNTKLNEDQLKRLHVILKPFMLRRIKKHVQKELGDKIEEDVFCDLTYRQRAYYGNLRNRISIMDLIEKAAIGDDQDAATLMNLVMQFRKVCNHPDLFERAETMSPFAQAHFAETASFMREGSLVNVGYSTRNLIEYLLPRLIWRQGGRIRVPGSDNWQAGFRGKYLDNLMNIWNPENIQRSAGEDGAFSWLRFVDTSEGEAAAAFHDDVFTRAVGLKTSQRSLGRLGVVYDDGEDAGFTHTHALFQIASRSNRRPLAEITNEGRLKSLLNISQSALADGELSQIEPCIRPAASVPPIEVYCSSSGTEIERQRTLFNLTARKALFYPSEIEEQRFIDKKADPVSLPVHGMLPVADSAKGRYTSIQVPSMRRFVTDSGKLAKLDQLLHMLKEGNHRVLLYFQMTRMIDLMEEYLTYRNFKYLRLDGSTKLEDRRDTVHDFQTRPDIFVFLLSTRAGGLGINLTAADTVIFYDSDWNPTIDSQAMDRAHRLGQTKQVTVYRMITRGTIEERIRKRALQKEEVQRVVISGGAGGGVDFNTRSRENRTKDIAMWLADDDQAAEIERKEAEIAAAEAKEKPDGGKKRARAKRKADLSLDEMYHEGEGHFDDGSTKPSGAATPVSTADMPSGRGGKKGGAKKGLSKKAKTAKERLRIADGDGGLEG